MQFENIVVGDFESAIRAARMPFKSFGNMDSYNSDRDILYVKWHPYHIGETDMKLLQNLLRAGDSDAKFMRSIDVSVEITAPVYWLNELRTYQIGTITNSSSLQHIGAKRDFNIRDFSIDDERVYDILDPSKRDFKAENPRIIPYETDEYKIYTSPISDRNYKIYRNGRIVACAFSYVDTYGTGRTRYFEEKELSPYQIQGGYWCVRLDGRQNNHMLIHRLVANTWLGNKAEEGYEINHKNKKRGDNSVENLEWVTHSENELHKNLTYKPSLATLYKGHKNHQKYDFVITNNIVTELNKGVSVKELATRYNISINQINYMYNRKLSYEYGELFDLCDFWEHTLDVVNYFRKRYKETNDYSYFRAMRQAIPMSFNYTIAWHSNYAALRNIWKQRIKTPHRLKEWTQDFSGFIEKLPYAKELIMFEG